MEVIGERGKNLALFLGIVIHLYDLNNNQLIRSVTFGRQNTLPIVYVSDEHERWVLSLIIVSSFVLTVDYRLTRMETQLLNFQTWDSLFPKDDIPQDLICSYIEGMQLSKFHIVTCRNWESTLISFWHREKGTLLCSSQDSFIPRFESETMAASGSKIITGHENGMVIIRDYFKLYDFFSLLNGSCDLE